MTTVAIVGAGEVGGSTAHALARSDRVGRLLLVDPAGSAAAGKALDLRQAGAIDGSHTRLEGTDDATRVAGCDACVVADRFGAEAGDWRGDEGLALLRQIAPGLGRAPIVFAGALLAGLLAAAAAELAIDRRRLMGSAPEAFASAVAAIVAMEANCSPREVLLTVLGAPPSGLVIPWTEASIGGYALHQMLAPAQLARIEARAARLWPPGPYALGAAAARLVAAILSSSRQSFCVLTQLGGEFGVRNRTGCLPVRLGPHGIVDIRVPELTTRERVQVQTALGASW
jgi:malate dehydrogenase